MEPAYVYRAKAARVIDGDTFIADMDLGFYASIRIHVRVYGLWSPELSEVGGLEAKAYADGLLSNRPLVIKSYKDRRSFERWVCEVWLEDGTNFAEVMIAAGHGTATQ